MDGPSTTAVRAGAAALLFALGACDCASSHQLPDAATDAFEANDQGHFVPEGCDDPDLWREAPPVSLEAPVGSDFCAPAQFPLFQTFIGFQDPPPDATTCWRVVGTHPAAGYGWGDVFTIDAPYLAPRLRGFGWPVTFEGRLLDAGGAVVAAGSVAPITLEEERMEAIDGEALVGFGSFEERVFRATDGAGDPWPEGAVAVTQSAGQPWLLAGGRVSVLVAGELRDLGAHERVVADPYAPIAALDRQLLQVDPTAPDTVAWSIVLDEDVRQVLSTHGALWALGTTRLFRVRWRPGTEPELTSVVVDGDRLVPEATEDAGTVRGAWLWDGTDLRRLARDGALLLDESRRFDSAAVGPPLAIMDGVALAERGFARWSELDRIGAVGPTSVRIEQLFEGATRIARVGADLVSYLVAYEDGSHTIHEVPHVGYCGP